MFEDLFRRRGTPCYAAFDRVWLDGEDLRELPLLERKRRLRRLLPRRSTGVLYVDHMDGQGVELFRLACERDLEGIVAKHKRAPYRAGAGSPWVKIKSRSYSQAEGRLNTTLQSRVKSEPEAEGDAGR